MKPLRFFNFVHDGSLVHQTLALDCAEQRQAWAVDDGVTWRGIMGSGALVLNEGIDLLMVIDGDGG